MIKLIASALTAAMCFAPFTSYAGSGTVKQQVCIAEYLNVSEIWGRDGNLSDAYLSAFIATDTDELGAIYNLCDKENYSNRTAAAILSGETAEQIGSRDYVLSEQVKAKHELRKRK